MLLGVAHENVWADQKNGVINGIYQRLGVVKQDFPGLDGGAEASASSLTAAASFPLSTASTTTDPSKVVRLSSRPQIRAGAMRPAAVADDGGFPDGFVVERWAERCHALAGR